MLNEDHRHPAGPIDIVCPKCGERATFRLTPEAAPHTQPHSDASWQSADPDWGACQCDRCVSRFEHALQWPDDAYWRTSVRGYDLWAHTRSEVESLLRYVRSTERDAARFPELARFLRHLPKKLLSAKFRDEVVKQLSRLLAEKSA